MRPRIESPAPCPRSRIDAGAARLLGLLVLGLLLAFAQARAASDHIEALFAAVETRDDGYYFGGDFDLDLKPRIAEALERGLTLYFVVEVELTRSRWYWFDERPVNASLTQRLS